MSLTVHAGGVHIDVPVVPDAPGARELLQQELSKPEYQAAQPSLWDIISKAFWDWVRSLRVPGDGPFTSLFPIIVMIVVAAAIVAAFLIWGVPRLNRRSTVTAELFGEHDTRTADELRRAARAAASAGDWSTAVQELYRAIARSLTERTVVIVTPGTTAHGFADRAARAFPTAGADLHTAADAFDAVRYLGGTATSAQYEHLDALDRALAASTPAGFDEPAVIGS